MQCFERTNYPRALSISLNNVAVNQVNRRLWHIFEKNDFTKFVHDGAAPSLDENERGRWNLRDTEVERTSRMHRRESSRGINRFLHSVQRRATAPPVSFNEEQSRDTNAHAVIDSITSGNYERQFNEIEFHSVRFSDQRHYDRVASEVDLNFTIEQ